MMRAPPSAPIRGLLRCLGQSFFIETFESEGYNKVGDTLEFGREEVQGFVESLCMPNDTDKQLLSFIFGPEQSADEEDACCMLGPEGPKVRETSGCMDAKWLEVVAPLYSFEMGCENMGPLLYSLLRFTKPKVCLEVGAGYTSIFLLQALEDNQKEEDTWKTWSAECGSIPVTGGPPLTAASWLAPSAEDQEQVAPVLHCVDNLAHAGTTTHHCLTVARRLGLEHHLRLHLDEGNAFLEESKQEVPTFDFIWLDGLLDFAGRYSGSTGSSRSWGKGIDTLLDYIWPRLVPGGLLMLHSTLTNSAVRNWIEGKDGRGPPSGAVLSLFEPMKKFQNSCTLIQKRPDGWKGEPIYSELP